VATRLPPSLIFVLIGGINVLLLVFLTPPFQVHDEFQHFFRSCQISEGRLWGVTENSRGGGMLPSSLLEFVEHSWGTLSLYKAPPLGTHPLVETWREFDRPLAPDRREFADFSGVVSYSPLAYLPQATSIALGRQPDASPLQLMYLGRLANATVAVAIIWWALKVLPIGREAALVVSLFPMAQFEYASLAPDAAVIATAFLFTAIALRSTLWKAWQARDVLLCVLCGCIFCSIKPVYAPLLLVGLPAIWLKRTRQSVWRVLSTHLAIVCCVMAVTVAWLASTWSTRVIDLSGADIQDHVSFITSDPIGYATFLARDVVKHARHYPADTIGIFGVWKVYLPAYAYILAIFTFGAACLFPILRTLRLPLVASKYYLMLSSTIFILLETALYVMLPTGDFGGIQGRYLLPLGALAAATFTSVLAGNKPRAEAAFVYCLIVGALLYNTVVMDITIITDYHLF
jgi:uncharacterized membrane protein